MFFLAAFFEDIALDDEDYKMIKGKLMMENASNFELQVEDPGIHTRGQFQYRGEAEGAAHNVPKTDPQRQAHAEEDPAGEEEGVEGEMHRKVSVCVMRTWRYIYI